MMSSNSSPSRRAVMMSTGLIITGRAASPKRIDGFICLEALAGGFFWVAYDGSRLLRGESLADAEELQPTFAEAMVRAAR